MPTDLEDRRIALDRKELYAVSGTLSGPHGRRCTAVYADHRLVAEEPEHTYVRGLGSRGGGQENER